MRRFIECLLPVSICNLSCGYCYISQLGWRKNEKAVFEYAPEHIGKALSIERLGGVSLISITGAGETLVPKELPQVIFEILKQGHFVNITTNGTLSKQIEEIITTCRQYLSHLHFSFSLHYIELKKRDLLDTFFLNVNYVRDNGCSILVQINLVDEYLPYWKQIKDICKLKVGAYPQVALTRDEYGSEIKILSRLSKEEYYSKGNEMESPLFNFTCSNFKKRRTEFCYAGLWSAKLNICTGEMDACYGNGRHQNIYEDLTKPIIWEPIGHHCSSPYCINSSHFISQGIIPELLPQLSYGELRNRETACWYSKEMKDFLYSQFEDYNPLLNPVQRFFHDAKYSYVMSHQTVLSYMFSCVKRNLKTIYEELRLHK